MKLIPPFRIASRSPRPGPRTLAALVLLLAAGAGGLPRSAGAEKAAAEKPAPPLPPALADENPPLAPRTGDALEKASRTFEDVLDRITPPDYLADAPDAGAPSDQGDADSHEPPPPAAARAYVRGRAAYLAGDRSRAITQLEQARRLDPDSAHVLRMLGKAYLARGDEIRGARRIQQAVRIAPADAASLFLLGRFAYQKGDWDEAIAVLARSARAEGEEEDQKGADPAIRYLRPYYLGQSLLQAGYDRAAIERLGAYLKLPPQMTRTTRLMREIAFLTRRRGRTRMQVGDAYIRLGEPAQALRTYAEAAKDEHPAKARRLLPRRLYAASISGEDNRAADLLIEQLDQEKAASVAVDLTSYVARHSENRGRFIDRLREAYREQGRPAPLALAIARLLDDDDATSFLTRHASDRPGDLAVYQRLVQRLGEDQPGKLVRLTLKMIRRRPDAARRYVRGLAEGGVAASRLAAAMDELPENLRNTAAGGYLSGAIAELSNQPRRALAAYETSRAADGGFAPAAMAMAELHAKLGEYEKALKLLNESPAGEEAGLRFTRARVLAGLKRYDEAAALLDDLLERQPRNPRYRLFQAGLQVEREKYTAAERTLLSILENDPANEDAYAALFQLYEKQPSSGTQRYVRLMKRLQREIPGSRLARLMMAQWHLARREFDLAEKNLRSILADRPSDDEALNQLVEVLKKADRWREAETLLLKQIQRRPGDPRPLQMLSEVAEKLGHKDKLLARREVFLKHQGDSLNKWVALAQLYMQWEKPQPAREALERAIDADDPAPAEVWLYLAQLDQRAGRSEEALGRLDEAIERRPDRAADLYYVKASIYQATDQPDRAERALLAALEADPDHAASNNDLGYLWADAGKNLQRAVKMAERAVRSDPDNGAYLDSLGWARYKIGDFKKAADRLQKAVTANPTRDPVILDHYGDARWRLGDEDTALRLWRAALKGADQIDPEQRPGIPAVRENLRAKIQAVGDNKPPPVAPAPGAADSAAKDDPAPSDRKGD